MDSLEDLKQQLRTFAQERDWDQYHSPKNIAMALTGEVGELVEHFQWKTEEESYVVNEANHEAIADELADVQLYLIRLADKLGIDLYKESCRKILKNADKYPVSLAKGKSDKYSDLK
ncbi:MAG: nucleotide pyrophosphohydrolase [Pseudomonadota bacterium]|nr:nucleotide pyrophosphohydrolase [Pseudomonadota bacterium]